MLNETNNPIQQIYESELNQVVRKSKNYDLAKILPSYTEIKTSLGRYRRAELPKQPLSISTIELPELYKTTTNGEKFLKV